MSPEVALILCRLLTDGAAILLWGTSAYLCTLVPGRLAALLDRRLHRIQVIAGAITLAMTVTLLPLRAATIGDGWNDAVDPATIRAVLFDTNLGTAWTVQMAAAILLMLAGFIPPPQRQAAMALAAAWMLATLPITGHAAMNEGWLRIGHRLNDYIHLLSGGAWLGSLVPVMMMLPYLFDTGKSDDARRALIRFSAAGHGAVAIVIATGVVNMFLIIGGPPRDWTFPYQALLLAKLFLVAVMTLMAIVNRYIFVPRLSTRPSQAMAGLLITTLLEITLGIAVVALVAWLGTLNPN